MHASSVTLSGGWESLRIPTSASLRWVPSFGPYPFQSAFCSSWRVPTLTRHPVVSDIVGGKAASLSKSYGSVPASLKPMLMRIDSQTSTRSFYATDVFFKVIRLNHSRICTTFETCTSLVYTVRSSISSIEPIWQHFHFGLVKFENFEEQPCY